MKDDVKTKFVAILREDQTVLAPPKRAYQLASVENRVVEYSALGMLVELYHREAGQGAWVDRVDYYRYDLPTGEKAVQFLPQKIADWAGCTRDPRVMGRRLCYMGGDKYALAQALDNVPAGEIN